MDFPLGDGDDPHGFACTGREVKCYYKHKHLRAAFSNIPAAAKDGSNVSTKVRIAVNMNWSTPQLAGGGGGSDFEGTSELPVARVTGDTICCAKPSMCCCCCTGHDRFAGPDEGHAHDHGACCWRWHAAGSYPGRDSGDDGSIYANCRAHSQQPYSPTLNTCATREQGMLERKGVVQFTLLPEEDYSSE